jgi:predicted MPP superfamily phosphohydrolase
VREITLAVPGWSAAHEGLRVALLADLHVGSPHHGLPKLRHIVDRLDTLQPDLVLLLGDYVITGMPGGRFVEPESASVVLHDVRARHGAFAVLGNHDAWFNKERVQNALERAGVRVLSDAAAAVEIAGDTLWLAGVSDLWTGNHDIKAALEHVPPDAPVLLFTHNPDIFPDMPRRVSLTVAGHTHGGQVRLPIIGRPVVPSRFGQRYAAGHVVEEGRHLFVSSGTGTSILPVRFRVPPEIVVLTLRPPDGVVARAPASYGH